MLKVLRNKKTAKKIWIGLALIIIPAFTLLGFGGAFRSREEKQSLGKISGRQVSATELRDSVSAVTTSGIMRFGDRFSELQKYLDIEAQAWQRLILLDEAKRRGIRVSDKEVVDLIESYPFFQYKGSFDNRIYNQTLQYVFRLQPRAFEEQTRQSLMLNKLFKQVTAGLEVSDKEAELAFDRANQEISISYIASPDKQKINLCAEELKSKDFNQAAAKCGLKVKTTPLFKLGDQVPGLASADIFWELAKSLKPGENSKVIELTTGFYIIKTKSLSARDEKKYGQEKSQYRQKALEQKQEETFNQFMAGLKSKARPN